MRLAALPLDLLRDELGELEELVVAGHAVVVGHPDGHHRLLKVAHAGAVSPSGGSQVRPGRGHLEDGARILRSLSVQGISEGK